MDCFEEWGRPGRFWGVSFNIRSFGSWIASVEGSTGIYVNGSFQYPLFRIVDCFESESVVASQEICVSISALSDRGLLLQVKRPPKNDLLRFNIRSFGSWIASTLQRWVRRYAKLFQYPLFRIVDCFGFIVKSNSSVTLVSISALSDRGLLQDRCYSVGWRFT